ncbi:MAG: hypothetical protein JOY66_24325 [Acetobacteraceae bacterium]|nr:hypothetical protein [Acetobacteraceae bacterium]
MLGTKTIMVLADASCGAVKAAIDAKPVPGQISTLYRLIRPRWSRQRAIQWPPRRRTPCFRPPCCATPLL